MRRIRIWTTAAVIGLSLIGNAFGQNVGDEVVVVTKEAELKHEATTVKTAYRRTYFTVQKINGNWLWVELGNTNGWLNKSNTIFADQAIEHFTEAIRRDSTDSDAFVARAKAWERKGELTNAIKDYSELIRLEPNDRVGYYGRGRALTRINAYDQAIADFDVAIQLNPKCGHTYYSRGDARYRKMQYQTALTDYEESIRYSPDSVHSQRSIAIFLATCPDEKFRNGHLAVEHATKACDLSKWKRPDALAALAAGYAETGDFAKAIRRQSQAIDLASQDDKPEFESRLSLYQTGQPYREVPRSNFTLTTGTN